MGWGGRGARMASFKGALVQRAFVSRIWICLAVKALGW